MRAECSIEGCDGSASSRGWCRKHYQRWLRRGDPDVGCQELLDPTPLLRQLELTLPDLRDGAFAETAAKHGWSTKRIVTDEQIAAALGVSRKTVQRWRHGGMLRLGDADRLAVRIGLDAPLLWPSWYELVVA